MEVIWWNGAFKAYLVIILEKFLLPNPQKFPPSKLIPYTVVNI